jgi:hypothetical protein
VSWQVITHARLSELPIRKERLGRVPLRWLEKRPKPMAGTQSATTMVLGLPHGHATDHLGGHGNLQESSKGWHRSDASRANTQFKI